MDLVQQLTHYIAASVDYEEAYAPDARYNEIGPNARVWNVYNDEAGRLDADRVKGMSETLDTLLIFVGRLSSYHGV